MKRTPHLLAAAMLLAVPLMSGCNGASDAALRQLSSGPTGFSQQTLVRGSRTRTYDLYVPPSFRKDVPIDRQRGYPVIIFLHGVGEGGSDARSNLRVGLAPFVAQHSAGDFNFICIFPQSENGSWNEDSEAADDVIACLDDVIKRYPVDQDRVSLTGLSTGGYGTWAIGAKNKDRFAALAPMASSGSAEKYADRLADMPVWSFHNIGDPFAASWNDSAMVAKIKSLGNQNATYTGYAAVGHNCWQEAYGDNEVFTWMLAQRRHHGTAMTAMPTPALVATAIPKANISSVRPVPVQRPAAPAPAPERSLAPERSQVRANASAAIMTPY